MSYKHAHAKGSLFKSYDANKHIIGSKKLLYKMKNIDNNYVAKDYRWKATFNIWKGTCCHCLLE